MSNLTNIPLIDNYRTNLSQEWNWATGTVYVATTPTFTFPSWITTYIVVNPWKTNMQIAEINSYNSTNKTLNVSNITLEKWASVNSTAQTHTVWSEVIISDNYQFWLDILTAINSKIDTLTWQSAVYANTTARDTAIPSPSNWMQVYITSEWKFYDYTAWSWTARESGWTFANASATVAWKVEIATTAESKAWTDTGGTWALLSVLPSDIAKNTQSWTFVYWHSTTWSDTYTVWLTPALTAYTTWMRVRVLFDTSNTWACSLNIDSLGAKSIKLKDWTDPLDWDITATRNYDFIYDGTNFVLQSIYDRASTSDATTWTNTLKVMSPLTTKDSIKDSFWVITTWLSFSTNYQASTSWIVAWYTWSTTGSPWQALCYVWIANPATTLVWKSWATLQYSYWFFSFPVKKWYYWRVDTAWTIDESSLTFTPNA